MFFEYPEKCRFGRKIPKNKFYEHANFNAKHKKSGLLQTAFKIYILDELH